MAQQPPFGWWTPTAVTFAQHQLAHVANFWKLGFAAEFHFETQASGTAELKLSFQLPTSSEPIPPPSPAPIFKSESLNKDASSKVRRRERRAAERAAAKFATKNATKEVFAESAGKAAAEKVVLVNDAAGKTENLVVETTETDLPTRASIAAASDCLPSTSVVPPVQCWNCEGDMSPAHQCGDPSPTSGRNNQQAK